MAGARAAGRARALLATFAAAHRVARGLQQRVQCAARVQRVERAAQVFRRARLRLLVLEEACARRRRAEKLQRARLVLVPEAIPFGEARFGAPRAHLLPTAGAQRESHRLRAGRNAHFPRGIVALLEPRHAEKDAQQPLLVNPRATVLHHAVAGLRALAHERGVRRQVEFAQRPFDHRVNLAEERGQADDRRQILEEDRLQAFGAGFGREGRLARHRRGRFNHAGQCRARVADRRLGRRDQTRDEAGLIEPGVQASEHHLDRFVAALQVVQRQHQFGDGKAVGRLQDPSALEVIHRTGGIADRAQQPSDLTRHLEAFRLLPEGLQQHVRGNAEPALFVAAARGEQQLFGAHPPPYRPLHDPRLRCAYREKNKPDLVRGPA
jgi:hypothetical protein